MAQLNGHVLIQLDNINVESKDDLEKSLMWLIPVISAQILDKKESKNYEDTSVSVSGTSAPQGSSGSVTVTHSGNSGSVSGTVTHGPGGTSGTVTGTYKF